MSDQPGNEARTFEAKSAVSIFDAPISWVALFGALIGALSIVPFLFYPWGGGFLSAGAGIFAPVAGMILGPWAGLVAGLIGGFIGMMISPAGFPLGFVDVLLSSAMLAFYWGLMQPKYRKLAVAWCILNYAGALIFPYVFPGDAWGVGGGNILSLAFSYTYGAVTLVMLIFLAPRIWKMYQSEKESTRFIGFLLLMLMATGQWAVIWAYPYWGILRFPFEAAVGMNYTLHWFAVLPMTITTTFIGYFLLRAMRKGNLKKIKGSFLEAFKVKE